MLPLRVGVNGIEQFPLTFTVSHQDGIVVGDVTYGQIAVVIVRGATHNTGKFLMCHLVFTDGVIISKNHFHPRALAGCCTGIVRPQVDGTPGRLNIDETRVRFPNTRKHGL